MTEVIYKVLTVAEMNVVGDGREFIGSPVDRADGYIHFSTAKQVRETVAKHFKEKGDLLLISFDVSRFGKALKWERSRGGDLFPHLYQTLDLNLAKSRTKISMLEDGSHAFPDSF